MTAIAGIPSARAGQRKRSPRWGKAGRIGGTGLTNAARRANARRKQCSGTVVILVCDRARNQFAAIGWRERQPGHTGTKHVAGLGARARDTQRLELERAPE